MKSDVTELLTDHAVIVAETGRNVVDLKDFQKVANIFVWFEVVFMTSPAGVCLCRPCLSKRC